MRRARICFALLAMAAACRHAAPAPADTLGAFGAAVEREDWVAAYALMSATYRARVPAAEFERQMRASPADATSAGRTLREGAAVWGDRVEIALGNEERATLVREGAAWHLETPPYAPFAQDTPRAALRAFIRAVEQSRYDVLVALAPARYRAAVTPEKLRSFWQAFGAERTTALLRDLRLAADEHIVEEGDEAFVVYGGGRQVRLVREAGLWRLESPE